MELAEGAPHPIGKITHFVEIGFLLDRNDFRLINTFDEATYDSNLKKYLFELQNPIENAQMHDLELKLKHQLTENVGLFNEINPVYISLNMGRPSTPFNDEYVTQDQFRLIKREGVFLMGSRWMMVNFLKSDYLTQNNTNDDTSAGMTPVNNNNTPHISFVDKQPNVQFILRVVAFENETNCSFSFDLNFDDILILMNGNIKLLEDESSHDLC